MQRSWDQTLGHKDILRSGTAATIIRLEDVPDGALRTAPVLANIAGGARASLTVNELWDDINWTHIEGVMKSTVLRIWVKHIPALSRFRKDVKELFSDKHAKHQLRLRKTSITTLRCSDINEATTAGVATVIDDILMQLGVAEKRDELGNNFLFVGGDQLTIDRLRKLRDILAKVDTLGSSNAFIKEKLELWHMKYNFQKAIFRENWVGGVGRQTYGLARDATILGREKFNAEKCDFFPGHRILEDRFEAMTIDILRYE